MKYFLIALLAFFVSLPSAAAAQDFPDPVFALELGEYNQTDPTQNDRYTRGSRLLGGKILDSQGRTLGGIADILIDDSGGLHAIDASLNRMGAHSANLPLDVSTLKIKPVQGGYQLAQNTNQVKSMMPQLLANVEAAAGATANGLLSVRKLIGGGVFSEKGPRLGTVEDVIFSYGGGRAHSLLLRVDYRTVMNKRVAIPLSAGTFNPGNLRTDVILPSPRAQTVVEFAK